MKTAVEREYTIKIREVIETQHPEMLLGPEERSKRLCWMIEKEIGKILNTEVHAVPVDSRDIHGSQAIQEGETDGMYGDSIILTKTHPSERENGYQGSKRWKVKHMLRGVRFVYARSPEMALFVAARLWGIDPYSVAERKKIWVTQIKQDEQ